MLTWIFLILALIVLTVLFTWIFGTLFGRGEILPPADEGEDVIQRNRECLAVRDLDGLSFDVVPRGYRPDQVEALIRDLKKQLANQGGNHPEILVEERNDL
ncbi:hypothetical protein COCCU_05300 [Corynebacterium occultum]|uniref:DivIVA domain-containing protein n=1 Tax=Corynebacterium occultum TaxID=2675219 RepID=A0A6B8W7Z1_9CORY|nr:cell division protein DivIVA [Corynebacterium occultum]QGU07006.1 hypothetical protein COCCU_05300 [Corynebacterium occultum]